MKTLIILALSVFLVTGAFANGGMIGGGEVKYKSLMVCKITGIDPTHESSSQIKITKEVGYDGTFNNDATSRIIIFNENNEAERYFVTNELVLTPKSSINISIVKGSHIIGGLQWDSRSNSGSLWSNNNVELQLDNCIYETDAL